MTDVVVSYSRRDDEFVERLVESISGRGKEGGAILSLATRPTVLLEESNVACGSPLSFDFSRDDHRVAGSYFCGYADVWDTRTGRLVRQVNQGGEVSAVDLSSDGAMLLVSSWMPARRSGASPPDAGWSV